LNKVVCVNSFSKPDGKAIKVKVPTGQKKKGLFGGEKDITRTENKWEQTGFFDCEIDGERLANDIAKAIDFIKSKYYNF
jgi:hypothetical protein